MDKIKTGNMIWEARTRKGYTQSELGALIGVSNKAVSRWENGDSFPDIGVLEQLSNILELSIQATPHYGFFCFGFCIQLALSIRTLLASMTVVEYMLGQITIITAASFAEVLLMMLMCCFFTRRKVNH